VTCGKKEACGGFMAKPDRKRPLGRPTDTEWDDVGWNYLP